jgi:phosphoserine aminotransferase
MDVSRFGLIYGGAQKNIGPGGPHHRDRARGPARARDARTAPPPSTTRPWPTTARCTTRRPPTASTSPGWSSSGCKRQGGVAAIEAQNVAKAKLLYDFLDASDFYENRVDPACRSRMNVPFFLQGRDGLNDAFLAEAKAAGLVQLKGHKSVGGMRASIYNAMPLAGVQALVYFMRDFAARRG